MAIIDEIYATEVVRLTLHTYMKLTGWAVQIDRVVGGKIVESWLMWGALGMM